MKRILAWLLIAVATVMFAGSAADVESSDARSFLPATAESTRALDLDEATFPQNPEQYLTIYARESGLTEADRASVAPDAIPSEDGKALLVISSEAPQTTDVPDGLEVRITGGAAAEADFDKAFDALDTTLLLVTVAVVAILLLITYRSPILLLIPLISVAAANQLANALVYWSAKNFGLVVDPQSAGILTVLVFGAGTDYAMLLIARYREERDMRKALRRSLPAIIASGATVILSLLTLIFADLNSTRGLGPVAAIGIACAMLAMTTLLPALLVLFRRWAFWPLKPKPREHSIWGRVADFVTARPRPIWITTALLLAAASLGTLTLSVGPKQSDSFTTKPDSVLGFELLAKHYPAGSSDPTYVYTPTFSAPDLGSHFCRSIGLADDVQPRDAVPWPRGG